MTRHVSGYSTCDECRVRAGFHAPSCSRAIREHSAGRWANARIAPGMRVQHIPTNTVRRVTGVRGSRVHFAQSWTIDGKTRYWADADDCVRVAP